MRFIVLYYNINQFTEVHVLDKILEYEIFIHSINLQQVMLIEQKNS